MNALSSPNLLVQARRHHKHERAKNPLVPLLVPGGGRVIANGSLKVELPAVNGEVFVYRAAPVVVMRFETAYTRSKATAFTPVATPSDRVKAHIDAALNAIIDVERRAAHLHSTITNIAAE